MSVHVNCIQRLFTPEKFLHTLISIRFERGVLRIMKKVFLLLSFVFFSSVPSGYGSIHSKQTEHYKTIFYQIHTFMQKASINRDITWNDELSRELENKFFDFFDPDQLVFDSDYREKMLREYGECLDDYISLGRYDLVKKNFDILKFYAHSQLKESESEML